jgi:hypothetical protein
MIATMNAAPQIVMRLNAYVIRSMGPVGLCSIMLGDSERGVQERTGNSPAYKKAGANPGFLLNGLFNQAQLF